jgi:hypothetical protein
VADPTDTEIAKTNETISIFKIIGILIFVSTSVWLQNH